MSALEVRRLKAFGNQVWGDAKRDLRLLRAIETTLDELDIEQERASQIIAASNGFIELVKNAAPSFQGKFDLVEIFDRARDAVGKIYSALSARRESAFNDPNLIDDDGIVDAFDVLLANVATLHNNLNTLSWLIGESAAEADTTALGVYTNSDDLFDAMGV